MSDRAINVARELGDMRLGAFHIRFAHLMGAILFIDGYDLFNAAYVAPYVKAQWALSPFQIGLMLSIGLAGLASGALLQGPLADRWGRRRVLLAAVTGLGLASLALWLWAPKFVIFCALRAVLGVCLGMISPLAFVYINEWAPARCANRYATLAFFPWRNCRRSGWHCHRADLGLARALRHRGAGPANGSDRASAAAGIRAVPGGAGAA